MSVSSACTSKKARKQELVEVLPPQTFGGSTNAMKEAHEEKLVQDVWRPALSTVPFCDQEKYKDLESAHHNLVN